MRLSQNVVKTLLFIKFSRCGFGGVFGSAFPSSSPTWKQHFNLEIILLGIPGRSVSFRFHLSGSKFVRKAIDCNVPLYPQLPRKSKMLPEHKGLFSLWNIRLKRLTNNESSRKRLGKMATAEMGIKCIRKPTNRDIKLNLSLRYVNFITASDDKSANLSSFVRSVKCSQVAFRSSIKFTFLGFSSTFLPIFSSIVPPSLPSFFQEI